MNKYDEHCKAVAQGVIELFRVEHGVWTPVHSQRNTVLYSAMDILSHAAAGERKVNGMYFAYSNASPSYEDPHPISQDRRATFYQSPGDGTRNFVRVPTLSRPEYSSSGLVYNENEAHFVAVTTGDGVLAGPGNALTDGTSNFYGAALAYLDPTDYTRDILFAAVGFGSSVYEKLVGAQFGLRWNIRFSL